MTTNEADEEYQLPIDFDALRESKSCLLSDFLLKDPVDLSSGDGGDSEGRVLPDQWFACIFWDAQVAAELEGHENYKCELHTTLYLGRLMSIRLRGNEELGDTQYWPGIAAMDWKRPFIMVDIISDKFGKCGINHCLRVKEINTITSRLMTGNGKPAIWDLVIFNECQPLAAEMVRRFKDGVKTTVVIWAAYKSVYEKPFVDGKDHVRGEIFLRETKNKEDILSVLIYHREHIGKKRRYRILDANKNSELCGGFQDNQSGCSWFCYSSSGGRKKENQLALHIIKRSKNGGGGHVDDVEEEECENECDLDLTVQSFPNSTLNSTFTTEASLDDTKVDVDTAESQYNFTELLDEL